MNRKDWEFREASIDEWIDSWSADPDRTRFQHPEWHQAFAKTWPGSFTPNAYRIIGADGTNAILPGSTRHLFKGFASEWIGSPGHNYSGLIGPHSTDAYIASQLFLLDRHSSYRWYGSPFTKSGFTMDSFTQVVDLDVSDEKLDRSMDHFKNLYFARRADRQGLRLERWHGTAEAYASIYLDAQNRWNMDGSLSNSYPTAFFDAVFKLDGTEIWAVTTDKDTTPIAMGIFLTAGTHVVSWLTLAREDALPLRPYQFLYVNLIRHYHQKGFKRFDFNPSGGLDGVIEFKQRFGAKKMPLPVFTGQNGWLRLLRTMRDI